MYNPRKHILYILLCLYLCNLWNIYYVPTSYYSVGWLRGKWPLLSESCYWKIIYMYIIYVWPQIIKLQTVFFILYILCTMIYVIFFKNYVVWLSHHQTYIKKKVLVKLYMFPRNRYLGLDIFMASSLTLAGVFVEEIL